MAFRHLEAVSPAEQKRAREIKTRYARSKKQAAVRQAALELQEAQKKVLVQEATRVAMAKIAENLLLDKGFNVDVTTGGFHHTTMRIRYVLVDKAVAHQMAKQTEFISSLRSAGFTKLVATDGFGNAWSWNL